MGTKTQTPRPRKDGTVRSTLLSRSEALAFGGWYTLDKKRQLLRAAARGIISRTELISAHHSSEEELEQWIKEIRDGRRL